MKLAIYGGSFNPPHVGHRAVVEKLLQEFDEVIIVPCGTRPDKPIVNDVSPVNRAAMVDLAFHGMKRVRIDLFDLEEGCFTRTHELEERFRSEGECWHVVGSDIVKQGAEGRSQIHTTWMNGPEVWRQLRFAVVERLGYPTPPEDLPPQSRLIAADAPELTSSDIRNRVFQHEPWREALTPRVAKYVERHRLYRGVSNPQSVRFDLNEPKFDLVFDERNPKAVEMSKHLERFHSNDPDVIVVLGGDGTMLRAVREHWRRRLPFYGINCGQLGFLHNQDSPLLHLGTTLVCQPSPLLYVEMECAEGQKWCSLSFNDCWVERASGQTAWIEVSIDGQVRMPQLIADGALVATAAGSTSYAHAMGAPPLPLGTQALLLVGSNVLRPAGWRPVVLPISSRIQFRTLNAQKRPLHAYVDGLDQGQVETLTARVSQIANAELLFHPKVDLSAKLALLQFPSS